MAVDVKEKVHEVEMQLRKAVELKLEELVNGKFDEFAEAAKAKLKEKLPTLGDVAVDLVAPMILPIVKELLLDQIEQISPEV